MNSENTGTARLSMRCIISIRRVDILILKSDQMEKGRHHMNFFCAKTLGLNGIRTLRLTHGITLNIIGRTDDRH